MRRRWYVEVIGRPPTRQARSYDEALELVAEVDGTWRILTRVGAGDAVIVRQGVGRHAA